MATDAAAEHPGSEARPHTGSVRSTGYDDALQASLYAAHADESLHNRGYERPTMAQLLPDVAGRRVLDAACAAGAVSTWLTTRGADVVGLDRSGAMIALARRRVPTGEFHVADLDRPLTMLSDASFDLVYSSLTLHYLDHPAQALRELHRVLRPGGTLVVSTHHPFAEIGPGESTLTDDVVVGAWSMGLRRRIRWTAERLYLETSSALRARRRPHLGAIRIRGLPVRFHRRTLSQVLNPVLDAGFVLDRIGEPRPDPNLRLRHPVGARRIAHRPPFLFLRAHRPATARPQE